MRRGGSFKKTILVANTTPALRATLLGGLNAVPKGVLKFGANPERESGEVQLLTDNS
jgi:hypothetical protein